MFDKYFKEKEEAKLREWLTGAMAGNPTWAVFALKTQWICPLCGTVTPSLPNRAEHFEKVWAHLREKCGPFATGVREPQMSKAQLEGVARFLEIKNTIFANPLWQQRDSKGHWYCPYCVRDADILIPPDGKIGLDLVAKIRQHVDSCFAYDHGRGQVKTIADLQKTIQGHEAVTRAIAVVKQKVHASPVWRVKDPKGFWVCPYCRQTLLSINVSSTVLMMDTAPGLIATHLMNHCSAYKEKKPPVATAEELEALVRPALPPPVEAGELVDTHAQTQFLTQELMEKMKKEMDQIKAEVGVDVSTRKGLEEARKKQMQMLPDLPTVPGFEFQVIYKPCSTVAGDFYDFPRISPDEIGLLMGDVSGHGIEAGIVMALVKKVISMHAKGRSSPKQTLVASNADIYPDLDRQTFATVCYCVLNMRTKELAIARAGHNPILIFNLERNPSLLSLEPKGMAVGVDKGPRFEATLEETVVQLQKGDMILVYTDGISEQTSPQGEEFGIERVRGQLAEYGNHEAKYLLHMIDLNLTEFRGPNREWDDDITLIGIKVK